jgi:hypothetical protein
VRDNAILLPTASGDGAGARFCAEPLPPSPPLFDTFRFFSLLLPVQAVEVTVESGGNFENYIRFLSCHVLGPVNHGREWERLGEKW